MLMDSTKLPPSPWQGTSFSCIVALKYIPSSILNSSASSTELQKYNYRELKHSSGYRGIPIHIEAILMATSTPYVSSIPGFTLGGSFCRTLVPAHPGGGRASHRTVRAPQKVDSSMRLRLHFHHSLPLLFALPLPPSLSPQQLADGSTIRRASIKHLFPVLNTNFFIMPLLPVAVYGLEVPCGGMPIQALPDFPATVSNHCSPGARILCCWRLSCRFLHRISLK